MGETARRDHLVVGLAPGPGRDLTRRVLDCASGRRLAALAGTNLQEVLRRCDTVNAYHTGDEPRLQAELNVLATLRRADAGRWRSVILLGTETCRLGRLGKPPLVCHDGTWFGLHHTSGLSRWWNDPDNLAAGTALLHEWWKIAGS